MLHLERMSEIADLLTGPGAAVVLEAFFKAGAAVIVHAGLSNLWSFGHDSGFALGIRTDDRDVSVLARVGFLESCDHHHALIGQSLRFAGAANRRPALFLTLAIQPIVLCIGEHGGRVLGRTKNVDPVPITK